jgi:hypothetical protein
MEYSAALMFPKKIIQNEAVLKGQCHEIFDLWVFHQTIPSGPLGESLFEYGYLIREVR